MGWLLPSQVPEHLQLFMKRGMWAPVQSGHYVPEPQSLDFFTFFFSTLEFPTQVNATTTWGMGYYSQEKGNVAPCEFCN